MDEKIITRRSTLRKQSHRDIYDTEVYAGTEVLRFHPVRLFENKVQVMLPDSFDDMPKLLAEIKYPSVQRPHVIKTSENCAVNFCFNLFDSPVQKEQIEATSIQFRSILQRAQPSMIQLDNKTENLPNTCISWFGFRSFSIDEQIYNLLFVTSIGGKLMNGAMSCPNTMHREWNPIMRQVVLSIEDHTEEEAICGK